MRLVKRWSPISSSLLTNSCIWSIGEFCWLVIQYRDLRYSNTGTELTCRLKSRICQISLDFLLPIRRTNWVMSPEIHNILAKSAFRRLRLVGVSLGWRTINDCTVFVIISLDQQASASVYQISEELRLLGSTDSVRLTWKRLWRQKWE